jgi:hypothetical protein
MSWIARLTTVAAAVCVAATAGCGGGSSAPRWEVEPAPIQRMNPPPQAGDRELRADVAMGALSDMPDPVERVDVRQDDHRIEIRVWIRKRIVGAGEPIPGNVRTYTAVIRLDNPVGGADIVDLAVDPPRLVPRA